MVHPPRCFRDHHKKLESMDLHFPVVTDEHQTELLEAKKILESEL
jgi:hypothetical protein